MLINKESLHSNAVPLRISNSCSNKVCIPKDMIIDTSEVIRNDSYSVNGIILTARDNDLKAGAQRLLMQKICTIYTHLDHSILNPNKENINNSLKQLERLPNCQFS